MSAFFEILPAIGFIALLIIGVAGFMRESAADRKFRNIARNDFRREKEFQVLNDSEF
jgi:hypothetical protein